MPAGHDPAVVQATVVHTAEKAVDLEKNVHDEKPTTHAAPKPGISNLWKIIGVAAVAAVALAIALGATSVRWNHPKDVIVPAACQFLGIKVGTLMPSIGASSTCNSAGVCYNMTADQMKMYIGTPSFVSLKPNYFSCIDGRHDNEIIATPAGDMGVFLSSAAIFISGTSTPNDFSQERMLNLLKAFILKFRSPANPFYYHTDTHAVERVVEKILEAPGNDQFQLEKMCEPEFVPPADLRTKLLDALSTPAIGIGCGHVKFMGAAPDKYGIPSADLVINTVRAIWDLRWGELRESIRIDELAHDHSEQAVLSITKIDGCDGMAPIVTQRAPGPEDTTFYTQQIFINHEAAVQPFRREIAAWWLSQSGASSKATADSFYTDLNTLTDKQLLESAVRLAPNRPLFNATVTGKPYTPPYNG